MATITLKGNEIHTTGSLPETGSPIEATFIATDLSEKKISDYKGKKIVLNIFPSIDTGVCAASVRNFNKEASKLENTTVLCISRDLPFAMGRFCGAEGIENVETLSDFKSGKFGKDAGLEITDGPLAGLHSRAIIVLDESGKVIYTEQVSEITEEPNYSKVFEVI